MVIRMDASPSGVTIWLSGELDHHAARSLRDQIDGAVDRTGAKRLRLDFEGVSFMDSSGIGLIMGRYRLMQLAGGQLYVTGASDRIRKIMRLAGLDRLNILEEVGTNDGRQKEDAHEAHQ